MIDAVTPSRTGMTRIPERRWATDLRGDEMFCIYANVAATGNCDLLVEDLNIYFILINCNYNSHMWPLAPVLNHTFLEC